MSLQELQETLLLLIRIGLWGKEKHKCLNLNEDSWKKLYLLARNQTVQAIVFDGIQELDIKEMPPKSILIPWMIEVEIIEKENQKQIRTIEELKTILIEENNIQFHVLKGQSIGTLYPNPLHRICGDIDLWFETPEITEHANNVIENYGISVERGAQNDSHYYFKDIEIEHHYNLIELHDPFIQKRLKNWEREVFQDNNIYPNPTASLLLQVTHILKHQLNEGIGLRQICDLAISLRKLDYNKEAFRQLCKTYGVYSWVQLLFAIITKHFGVGKQFLPFPPKGNPDTLLNEIWQSGNFGYYDTRFGNRPSGFWKSKFYTFKLMARKSWMYFRFAPEESLWNTILLAYRRIKELLFKI